MADRISLIGIAFQSIQGVGDALAEVSRERVQSSIPNPVIGDMYDETVYSSYKHFGGGVSFRHALPQR